MKTEYSAFRRFGITSAGAFALAIGTIASGANAQSVGEFYNGKTLTMVIGTGAGGNVALYGRVFGNFFGKHLAGNPSVIQQYMPGGGGRKTAGYMDKVAPKDGTFMAMTIQTVPFAQKLQPESAKYNAASWNWIGNMAPLNSVMAVIDTAGVNSIEDARKKQIIVGATGKSSGTYIDAAILNRYAGTQFKIVTGYAGLAALRKAVESGEIHGFAVNFLSWKTGRPDWVKSGKIKFIAQAGLDPDPDLKGVPMVDSFGKTELDKKVLHFSSAGTALARAVFVPAGVPADRVAALRKAFDDTMADPAFKAEAEKRQMVLTPSSGEKVQEVVRSLVSAPADVVRVMKDISGLK